MLRQVFIRSASLVLISGAISGLSNGAMAGPYDAAPIGASLSGPSAGLGAAPVAPLPAAGSLTSPLNGLQSAPTPVVTQLARPAAAVPAPALAKPAQ